MLVPSARLWLFVLATTLAASACDLQAPLTDEAPAADEGDEYTGDEDLESTDAPLYFKSGSNWTKGWNGWTHIHVCWKSLSNDPNIRDVVRASVEDTWGRHAPILFWGWGQCTGGEDVQIYVRDEAPAPHANGLGTSDWDWLGFGRDLTLNFTYNNWSQGCRGAARYCTAAIAVHEFGHVLGFAHEQNRPDSPQWCVNDGQMNAAAFGPQGENGDMLLGLWDPSSVMNYCSGDATNGPGLWDGSRWMQAPQLSAGDIYGLQRIYGRKPSGTLVAGGEVPPPPADSAPNRLGPGSRCVSVATSGMGVSGNGTANGTALKLWDCGYSGAVTQSWFYRFASIASGDGFFENRNAGNKVLEVKDISRSNLATVQIWDPWKGPNQFWTFKTTRIRGLGGMSIGGAATLNAKMSVYTHAQGANAANDLTFTLRANGNIVETRSGLCLDTDYGSSANGTRVQLYTCIGSASQVWKLEPGGAIRGVGGKCLDVRAPPNSNSTLPVYQNGQALQVWDCNGWQNQKFNLNGQVSVYSGTKCLDVQYGYRHNGATIGIWDCIDNHPNEVFDYYP